MTLKQNWTVAISWVQSLKWRTRQIYQDLKKAVKITSHFISVNLIYNAVSTECGTLKMTFIRLKTPQPIRFANHNSIDEVANAKHGKSARLPWVFPRIGWASRTRLFFNAKQSKRKNRKIPAFRTKIIQLSTWPSMNEMTESECLAKFRFGKRDIPTR